MVETTRETTSEPALPMRESAEVRRRDGAARGHDHRAEAPGQPEDGADRAARGGAGDRSAEALDRLEARVQAMETHAGAYQSLGWQITIAVLASLIASAILSVLIPGAIRLSELLAVIAPLVLGTVWVVGILLRSQLQPLWRLIVAALGLVALRLIENALHDWLHLFTMVPMVDTCNLTPQQLTAPGLGGLLEVIGCAAQGTILGYYQAYGAGVFWGAVALGLVISVAPALLFRPAERQRPASSR